MAAFKDPGFTERQKAAAEARKAALEKFRSKPGADDPAVLERIAGWGFQAGLRPRPNAPVWPMSAFRDRFLSAFGSLPRQGGS